MSLLAAAVLLLAGAPRYVAYKTHELIGLADLMVTGTIVEVGPKTVLVKVERHGFGDAPAAVTVRRFRDWTCARRFAPYERGQRCLYFLHEPDAPGEPYEILGAGNEGERELPGAGEWVELHDRRTIGVDALVSEARRYLAHFRFHGDTLSSYTVEAACSAEELAAYVRSSPFARELARATLRKRFRDPDAVSPAPVGRVPRWDLGIGPVPRALVALPDLDGDGRGEVACAQDSLSLLYPRESGAPGRASLDGDARRRRCDSVAALGDLDGDGTQEVAAAEPDAPVRDAVWIYSLGDGGEVARATRLELDSDGADMGDVDTLLADVGDLDGDGRRELALGESSFARSFARIRVVFLDPSGRAVRAALASDAELGWYVSLAGLGDLDGDGVGDAAAATSTSKVRILLLARAGSCREALDLGRADTPDFGRALASLGDLDGDGTLELAVASRRAVHVLSLARDGSIARERALAPADFADVAPERAYFGSTLCAWPSADGVRLLAGGFSWFDPDHRELGFPSLWVVDPR